MLNLVVHKGKARS